MIGRGVLADTGPLYAGVDEADQYYALAQEQRLLLEESHLETIVIAPILTEAHALCLHRLGRAVSGQWLRFIVSSSTLAIPHKSDYRNAIRLTDRFADQSITLTDAVLAVMSRRLRIPVWTYDHHFDIMQVAVWRD